MNNTFFETSKLIANNFLQNIVFIDDKAYTSEEKKNNHEFNAFEITKAFAKSQKICAVYQPKTIDDISDLAILTKKADITVIDWQIILQQEAIKKEDKEKDADADDPRGPHTLKIISEILSDSITGRGSLKLILVYTGETDLPGITSTIFKHISQLGIVSIEGDCAVSTENAKILVIAKSSLEAKENKFKHKTELNKKVVKYEDLPEFILTEFTKMTNGLLSNFVLQSLTALRNNTFRLVKLYNKDLDASFLHHRLLLPNQDDSKEQMVEVLSHSLQALLNYNQVGETVSIDNIKLWIEQSTFSKKINVSKKEVTLDNNYLKKWCEEGLTQTITKYWSDKGYDISKSLVRNFEDAIHEKGSSYLTLDEDNSKQDSEFSILTHQKSNLKQPSVIPKLTLGSIIKQDDGRYFVCIQAKCDSMRVSTQRKFLFLPLEVITGNGKFHFIVQEGGTYTKLKTIKETYGLRTIIFDPVNGETICAKEDEGTFFFSSSYGEKLIWICDLKDAHAQRIANAYAYQLSRVGLDESEWLRRWAGN